MASKAATVVDVVTVVGAAVSGAVSAVTVVVDAIVVVDADVAVVVTVAASTDVEAVEATSPPQAVPMRTSARTSITNRPTEAMTIPPQGKRIEQTQPYTVHLPAGTPLRQYAFSSDGIRNAAMYQRDVSHRRRMPDLGMEPHASVGMSG